MRALHWRFFGEQEVDAIARAKLLTTKRATKRSVGSQGPSPGQLTWAQSLQRAGYAFRDDLALLQTVLR